MPIYEYECKSCGHILDALQKMSEDPLQYCPECGEHALKRLLSAPRFRLKGEGWYETDFKTGDKKRNLHAEDKPSKDTKSDDSKKSDSSKKTEKSSPSSKTGTD